MARSQLPALRRGCGGTAGARVPEDRDIPPTISSQGLGVLCCQGCQPHGTAGRGARMRGGLRKREGDTVDGIAVPFSSYCQAGTCLLLRAGSQRAPGMPDTPCPGTCHGRDREGDKDMVAHCLVPRPQPSLWPPWGTQAPCSVLPWLGGGCTGSCLRAGVKAASNAQGQECGGGASPSPCTSIGPHFRVPLPALVRHPLAPDLTCFSAWICLLGEAAREGQEREEAPPRCGVAPRPQLPQGQRHPQR